MADLMGQEALRKGFEQGFQQGLQHGAARMLLLVLEGRFGAVPEDVKQRVAAGSYAQILRWAKQLVEAQGLAACFEETV